MGGNPAELRGQVHTHTKLKKNTFKIKNHSTLCGETGYVMYVVLTLGHDKSVLQTRSYQTKRMVLIPLLMHIGTVTSRINSKLPRSWLATVPYPHEPSFFMKRGL